MLLSSLSWSAYGDLVTLDVPTYDQEDFGHGCTMDCSPTAAGMVLGYWNFHGWPRMVPGGSADYEENPDGVRDLVMDLWVTMEYTCSGGTAPEKVATGIIATASNMDPGAEFVNHSFLEITNDNKETAFEILKGYIDNGWPVLFSSYAGLKYYCPNDNSYGELSGGHSMVMTGYLDSDIGRRIFLNSGWGYPKDKMWLDYDDLGVDLDITDPKQIWITCVVPGGFPSPDNVALGKPVIVTTNGANDDNEGAGLNPSDINDGSLEYFPASQMREDGCVGYVNNDYNEPMVVEVTIDLQGTYNVSRIRYNMGNVQRAETWNADLMTTPFGTTSTNPGTSYAGVWTVHAGRTSLSSVTVILEKTRTSWPTDWLFIGEIEVYESLGSSYAPTVWSKYEGSPVIEVGSSGSWDA